MGKTDGIRTKLRLIVNVTIACAIVLLHTILATIALRLSHQLEIFGQLCEGVTPLVISCIIIFLIKKTSKKIIYGITLLTCIWYCIDIFLLLYKIDRRFSFDFFFLWYNLSDAIDTVLALMDSWFNNSIIILTIGIFFLSQSSLLAQISQHKSQLSIIKKTVLLCSLIIIFFPRQSEILTLLHQFNTQSSKIQNLYYQYFIESIKLNTNNELSNSNSFNDTQSNIFMIHLESVNALLVNEKITPQLINITRENGILYPSIQASSILTIRSQEVLLCGIVPSLGENLSNSANLTNNVKCLPKIMKAHGYKTLFFQSYSDLNFGKTGSFMKKAGFDEIHAKDIMQPTDQELKWGFPEDKFYQRVYEYLQKYKNEKLFVYIAVSSTNHYPFYNKEKENAYPQFINEIPYKNPKNIKEKIADTTYIQDNFFGNMIQKWFLPQFANNSYLFAFGDHSWPIEVHPNNKFNENEAYQENFVSTLAILLPSKKLNTNRGKTIKNLHSHLDIMNTIIELALHKKSSASGHSFAQEIETEQIGLNQPPCIISVQPFADKYISTIRFPEKETFNITKNTITKYNLNKDPNEENPISTSTIRDKDIANLKTCLEQTHK